MSLGTRAGKQKPSLAKPADVAEVDSRIRTNATYRSFNDPYAHTSLDILGELDLGELSACQTYD